MRRIVFLALVGIIFISCMPQTVSDIKEINYTTPTIIDESLDIGLFAPFEVPLVQEREYEFTATTKHKYVRIHFVIPGKEGKWISCKFHCMSTTCTRI